MGQLEPRLSHAAEWGGVRRGGSDPMAGLALEVAGGTRQGTAELGKARQSCRGREKKDQKL